MVSGCGDDKPYHDTSLTEATVSGVVTAKGEPVTAGTISFNAANSGRIVAAKTAEIGPDGHYTLKTYTGDNQVTYGGEVAKKNMGVGLRKDFATVKMRREHFDFDVLGEGGKSSCGSYKEGETPEAVRSRDQARGEPAGERQGFRISL